MSKRAVFIDRDGTLVHPVHFPSRPEQLRLFDGVGPELRTLQQAGFLLVLITNQSGIAHGYFTEVDLQRMHEYLADQLAQFDVHLDGVYYCPHHPEGALPEFTMRCDCRKPRPGMLLQAAADLDIDLHHSWFVGDILDDVEAGNRAGCHTALVDPTFEQESDQPLRCPDLDARDTVHALRMIVVAEHLNSVTNSPSRIPT
jgi:D-glycero-D-manno-heptose 1,7-bisphosphate phosphatase